jgi:hypothetical protein
MTFFALFLFVIWVLPLLAGAIQSLAWRPSSVAEGGYPSFALSPVAGIGMTAAVGDEQVATAVQASTITPALLFTFVFNYMLIGARRRIMKRVFVATDTRKKEEVEMELVGPAGEGASG